MDVILGDVDPLMEDWSTYRLPLDTPALPDIPEKQQLRRQADLAIEGFRRLIAECEFRCPSTPVDLDMDRLRSKKDLPSELSDRLLPLLQNHFSSLEQALDRAILREDTASQLALVLELQRQIGQTLHQTIRTMDEFTPGRVPEPNQTDDQHYKDLKCFRLYGLDVSIREDMRSQLISILEHSRKVIEELKTPTKIFPSDISGMCFEIDGIELPLSWLQSSELRLIWKSWGTDLYCIGVALEMLTYLTTPTYDSDEDSFIILSESAVQLGKSLLPIMRLSKLFFDKLEREGMYKKKAPVFTKMSSQQLTLLNKSVGEVVSSINNMYQELKHFRDFDERGEDVFPPDPPWQYGRRMNLIIDRLKTHFSTITLLVAIYIVPLFSDVNDLSTQTHFNDWFITWHTLFLECTQNAIQAAHVFAQTDPR
ncbi:hypothetical protein Pst134EA_029480 [Puccinia striiformis f. sp. tritici]|uniref:hypothetical protein n=1 Tax=Puccinia striiformis f. sp. tritici TaxID=168172 RepID=UPI000A1238D8|nr:hypothetical protein Pst134EA_029480 [Puccinia striiformis f. sp. tritici]KAH9447443.1 hypothetical protein Pst134EA_029480 [Puccinia striiformis f. sp. tritici]